MTEMVQERDSSVETLVGGALLNKSLLLSRLGRVEEVIETGEVLLKCFVCTQSVRFSNRDDYAKGEGAGAFKPRQLP